MLVCAEDKSISGVVKKENNMRLEGWETRHKEVVEFHTNQPGEYGVSDCYLLADDNVYALTGQYMFPKCRKYNSKKSAAKLLVKNGFENVEQAFASKFDQVHPSFAHRGDIGVIERDGEVCGGVFTALGFAVRGEDRLYFYSASDVKTAFKVGRE